ASETACSKAVSELVRQNLKDQKVCAIPVCRPKSWYDAYVVTFSRRSNTYWCGKIEEFEAKLKMVEEEVGHIGTTTAERQRALLIPEAHIIELSWLRELS
ncbi:MAG: hypothetical protein VXA68_11430, partial [Gammaproteobacteria bacterium]